MKHEQIAVIAYSKRGFEIYVRDIYNSLPPGVGVEVSPTGGLVIIKHPSGLVQKYRMVLDMEDLSGVIFDAVEKAHDFRFIIEGDKLYDCAVTRIRN